MLGLTGGEGGGLQVVPFFRVSLNPKLLLYRYIRDDRSFVVTVGESYMLEDKILIWKARRGERQALCRIYEKYEQDLLTLAMNLLGDRASGEDVVHDVFVKFTRSLESFRLTGSLKGYLSTCVANRARDMFRQRQRRKWVALDETEHVEPRLADPLEDVIRSEQLQQLAHALGQLSYEQREAIVLHVQGGLTFRQIANGSETSVNTVKSRYRYGMERLRSLMNSEVPK